MNNSYYPCKAIKTLEELSKLLGIDTAKLVSVGSKTAHYCQYNPQPKPDGTTRDTYAIKEPLKHIHARIKQRILDRVHFAEYLFFGIPKKQGVKENAAYHCRAGKPKILISLDIKQFFPSITVHHINNVWQLFFNFSEEVSELLTNLVLIHNQLIQGAVTSNHLSNLVFCRDERGLVSVLNQVGATYSRYADDIAITLHQPYDENLPYQIIKKAIGFISSSGFKCHRKKFSIATGRTRMMINNSICINNAYQSANKEKRHKVKKRVEGYITTFQATKNKSELITEYRSIRGQLYNLISIHPHNGCKALLAQLKKYDPTDKTTCLNKKDAL